MESRKELVYNNLCKISPMGIAVFDLVGNKLISASLSTHEHLGFSRKEFDAFSQNWFQDIIHPQDRNVQVAAYHELVNNPELYYKEFSIRIHRKDGNYAATCVRIAVLELDTQRNPTPSCLYLVM